MSFNLGISNLIDVLRLQPIGNLFSFIGFEFLDDGFKSFGVEFLQRTLGLC